MKKLLLTSAGFFNKKISDEFLKLIDKPTSKTKVIFVPTASKSEDGYEQSEVWQYVKESRTELIKTGIKEKNIKTLDLDHKIRYKEIAGFDIIYVCGGNTFYLLSKAKESGFDTIIKEYVENGGVYVGVSAGSILAGPDIEITLPWDNNDIGLKDFTALNLTDKIICPHYTGKDKKLVEKLMKKSIHPLLPLTDSQALLVIDEESRII